MTTCHAVLWIDADSARLRQFDAEHVEVDTLRPPHEGRDVQQVYFDEVCEALDGIQAVLVTGTQPTLSAFRHHVQACHPGVARRLVAFEPLAPLSEAQLLAHAREFFAQHRLSQESAIKAPAGM